MLKIIINILLLLSLNTLLFAQSTNMNVIDSKIKEFDRLEYFGYNLFDVDTTKNSEINNYAPISNEYIVSVNDEVVINVWGDLNFKYILTVSENGFIEVPKVGRIYLNGNNFSNTKKLILKHFANTYSASIDEENPSGGTSTIDISMGKVSNVEVVVAGEINKPGLITLYGAKASVLNLLNYSKGITKKGTLREIVIRKHDSNDELNLDLYDLLLNGRLDSQFRYLSNGDVVYVKLKEKEVFIKGFINRPGIYELKPAENFRDLLNMVGGFLPGAMTDKIQIIRSNENRGREILDISLETNLDVDILDGDYVNIFQAPKDRIEPIVSIEGEGIINSGVYQFRKNLKISDLIYKAGGLQPDVLLDRIDLIRTNKNFQTEIFTFDLSEILEENADKDITLQPMDKLITYSEYEMTGRRKSISITGHVKRPGDYTLHKNFSLYDLLFTAGGFNDFEYRKKTYLERADIVRFEQETQTKSIIPFSLKDILDNRSSEEIELTPGDVINIYAFEQFETKKYVYINGEVKKPGKYILRDDLSVADLISLSEGYTESEILDYIEIARIINDNENILREIIKINKTEINSNFLLQDQDIVIVRKDPAANIVKAISITGAIKIPGEYSLISQNEQLSSLIGRAGGLTSSSFTEGIEFFRINRQSQKKERMSINYGEIVKNQGSDWDIKMIDQDSVNIPEKDYSITVYGEVNFPKKIQYKRGEKAVYYIEYSGGYTSFANKNEIKILTPSGKILTNKKFWPDPFIPFGSKIFVPSTLNNSQLSRINIPQIEAITDSTTIKKR